MATIETYLGTRDNNFNMVRVVAASVVFVSHCFAIATGNPDAEPLHALVGMSLGTVALHLFFVTSGFLVTGSMLKRHDVVDFLVARILRIVPGLFVCLCTVTVICGLFFSKLSVGEFFSSSVTVRYVARNSAVLLSMIYELPGVFESNLLPRAVNGSLWTLPYEARLYLVVAAAGLFAQAFVRHRQAVGVALLLLLLASTALMLWNGSSPDAEIPTLCYMFFAGSMLFIGQRRVSMSNLLAGLGGAALLLGLLNPAWFRGIYLLVFPWLVLWVALVPAGAVREFNRLGDYSYGIYIYAFPIQQMVVSMGIVQGPAEMMAVCALPILAVSMLSWHFVEKPSLEMRASTSGRVRRFLGLRALPVGKRTLVHEVSDLRSRR